MSKATTSIPPPPKTFNVDKKYHELRLRNFVPSRSLLSQSVRHTNFELRGNGGRANNLKLFMLAYSFCELLSVNSPLTQVLHGLPLRVERMYIHARMCRSFGHRHSETTKMLQSLSNQLTYMNQSIDHITKKD